MKKPTLLLVGAEIVLLATAVLFLAFQNLWNTLIGVSCVVVALVLVGWLVFAPTEKSADGRTVGVGTVCAAGDRQITIQVTSVHGEKFIGRLVHYGGDAVASWLRPGAILLVAFDPTARERLSLPDDMLAVRATDVCST
ncbi:hypothetical protein [Mycobacterium sp.]|uniref:hypothetical protein n=1 Tax=Mycobacterium sp. TaxID=1785 RepID=UPI003F972F6F